MRELASSGNYVTALFKRVKLLWKNTASVDGVQAVCLLYVNDLAVYKLKLRKAKHKSRVDFCSNYHEKTSLPIQLK